MMLEEEFVVDLVAPREVNYLIEIIWLVKW